MKTNKRIITNKLLTRLYILLKCTILFAIVLIGFLQSVYAQKWKENKISVLLNNNIIYDVANLDNTQWILTNKNIFVIHHDIVKKFIFNENSQGNINNYEVYKDSINPYYKIIVNDKNVWLINNNNLNFLKISNDSIKSFSISDYLDINHNTLKYYSIDNNGILHAVYTNYEKQSKIYTSYMIYVDSNKIEKISLDHIINMNTYVTDFFIYNDLFYIILNDKNHQDSIMILQMKGSLLLNKIIFNNKVNFKNHFIDSSSIYLLDIKGILYELDIFNCSLKRTAYIKNINNLNFDNFIISNDIVYIPDSKGLIIYDINKNVNKKFIPPSFFVNCFWGFNKINKINNKEFWLIYGGIIKQECNEPNYGLAIFLYE